MLTNFRDIGNIQVKDGLLKENFFFRSGQLVNLSKDEKDNIKNKYNISKVFDFRSSQEVIQSPDTYIKDVEIVNLSILDSEEEAPSLENMKNKMPTEIDSYMMTTYSQMVLNKSALKAYKEFLETALLSNRPILFHCFAGKDRTGIAAALILKISGATDEQIMADYLKTNTLRQKENQLIIDKISGQNELSKCHLNAIETMLNVKSDYLIHAYKQILQRYDTFESFLCEGLKLKENYVSQFRQKFVLQSDHKS